MQAVVLLENPDTVSSLGFEVEPFGTETVLVRAIPAMLGPNEIGQTLAELANSLSGGQKR